MVEHFNAYQKTLIHVRVITLWHVYVLTFQDTHENVRTWGINNVNKFKLLIIIFFYRVICHRVLAAIMPWYIRSLSNCCPWCFYCLNICKSVRILTQVDSSNNNINLPCQLSPCYCCHHVFVDPISQQVMSVVVQWPK